MKLVVLSADRIRAIHDSESDPVKAPLRAKDRRVELALAHIDTRITYGLIEDAFYLAAAYAMAIARGRCFNDGNKRTAFRSMHICLELNGIPTAWNTEEVGQMIIRCARGIVEDGDLADWLRQSLRS